MGLDQDSSTGKLDQFGVKSKCRHILQGNVLHGGLASVLEDRSGLVLRDTNEVADVFVLVWVGGEGDEGWHSEIWRCRL